MALQGIDVCLPHSPSMESSTLECVERSLDTSTNIQMHLLHMGAIMAAQLIITTLMELASLMGRDQGNTFGHLLQLMVIPDTILVPALALRWILGTLELSHHS